MTKMFKARVPVDKAIKNHDFRGFQNRQQIESQLYPWSVYKRNEVGDDRRTQKLEKPKRRTSIYRLPTFWYLGSKLWNLLASKYSEVDDTDYMNYWNSWWSTGLEQIMIMLRDISFDLPFVSYMCVLETMRLFITLIVHTVLHCNYLHYLYIVY